LGAGSGPSPGLGSHGLLAAGTSRSCHNLLLLLSRNPPAFLAFIKLQHRVWQDSCTATQHSSQLLEMPRVRAQQCWPAMTPAAGSARAAVAVAATGCQPRIGSDLSLHPRQLHAAYWRDKNRT
jgi:hypothetical protein